MRRWTLTTLMAGSLLLGGAPLQAAPVDAGHEIPRPAGTVAQFKVDLDSEGPTTFVLSRVDGIYGLQAWRYSRALDSMSKVTELQAALDAIVADKKTINEAQVRAALASLQLIDYSVVYHRSGNPQFDTIDHAQGKLVGYFNAEGQPVRQSRGQPAFAYKKTFQEKDGHFLTVTYVLGFGWQGAPAPSYHLRFINWETEPSRFSGSQDGPGVEYDTSCCAGELQARPVYRHGQRIGQ